ncbi:rho-related protein racd-related [Anaeramoeba flamelloides]|uniref:Rho-related protein racd-related n=1 Tax=Anaeramoeba flamelloides TaxID=1746091 RepID=A0ABQ8ZB59_9EUKA|nr:rho-related protein racd-related [Anaeramoeba flamelloides]
MSDEKIKIVQIGNDTVGKTSLFLKYILKKFSSEYIPTVFNYIGDYTYKNQIYRLDFWDTSEGKDEERLRPLSYCDANVLLISFSMVSPESFQKLETKWIPEMNKHAQGVPFILVGTKYDLVGDEETKKVLGKKGQKPLTILDGNLYARKIGAELFVPCSSVTGYNVQYLFDCVKDVFDSTYQHTKNKKMKWVNNFFKQERITLGKKQNPPLLKTNKPSNYFYTELSSSLRCDQSEKEQETNPYGNDIKFLWFLESDSESGSGSDSNSFSESENELQINNEKDLEEKIGKKKKQISKRDLKPSHSICTHSFFLKNTNETFELILKNTKIAPKYGIKKLEKNVFEITDFSFKAFFLFLQYLYGNIIVTQEEDDLVELIKISELFNVIEIQNISSIILESIKTNSKVIRATNDQKIKAITKKQEQRIHKLCIGESKKRTVKNFVLKPKGRQGKKIYLNKLFLASRSNYFKNILINTKCDKLVIDQYKRDTLSDFVRFLYTDRVPVRSLTQMKELFKLSIRFECRSLFGYCQLIIGDKFVTKAPYLNLVSLYSFFHKFECPELIDLIFCQMGKHYTKLSNQKVFKDEIRKEDVDTIINKQFTHREYIYIHEKFQSKMIRKYGFSVDPLGDVQNK